MHTIQCPNCQKTFAVPKPVEHARVRCSNCQNVFMATSHETPSAARPAAPAQPPRPAAQAPPSRVVAAQGPRKGSNLPAIIVAVCLVGFAGVGLGVWYVSSTEVILYPDPLKPGVMLQKRVSHAEAQRVRDMLAAQEEKDKDEKAKKAAAVIAKRDAQAAGVNSYVQAPDMPELPSEQSATSSPATMYSEATDVAVKSDPSVRIDGLQIVPSPVDRATGEVIGQATNPSDTDVIEAAEVIVWFWDEKKQAVQLCQTPPVLAMIPPHESIPFSRHYWVKDYRPPLLATVEKVKKAPPGTVAWIVPDQTRTVERKGTQIIYANCLKDPFERQVKDVKIYLSAFDDQGVQIGETKIVDLPGRDLWPDRPKDIKIAIDDPSQEGALIAKWVARAVGTK